MKRLIRWTLALAVAGVAAQWNAVLFAQFVGGFKEQHATLTIKSDGSSQVVGDFTLTRTMTEQMVRAMERFQNTGEGEEPPKAPAETKPFTDDELVQKIHDMMKTSDEESGENSAENAKIQVDKDTVRIGTTRDFASLEELLKDANSIWGETGLRFENIRFETTNSQLRVTLSPFAGAQRYARMMRQQWKLTGAKTEFKMVLPGKILSSGFPTTQDDSTSISINGQKDETLDAAAKLFNEPVVITAELGGLKLDQPLESKTLQRQARRRGDAADELPVTDAGPGFVAEPVSITTTTLHLFPDGEKFFKESSMADVAQTGAVVNAKLFAPKGRTLQSVTGARILKATDDKGRAIAPRQDDNDSVTTFAYSGDSRQSSAVQIQLRLELPQPDAQSIDELSAEAIAVTAGSWKQMTLTNIQENATNELDLADVLPGAKLVVAKFNSKNGQVTVQAEIRGPKTIRQLELQAKIPGNDQFNSNSFERSFRTQAGQSTRTLMIQGYGFGENRAPDAPVAIVVRCPEDLKRERVNFKLKGLDLL